MKRQQGKEPLLKQMIRYRQHYVMLIPFFLIFTVFTVWPVIMSVILSFTNYNVFETPKFVGWDNYVNLLVNDDVFVTAFRNTIVFAIFTGPVSFFISMFLAWIINELPKGIRELMTLVFYAPSISGNAFAVWLLIFDGDIYGYLNSFLLRLGFISEPIIWLKDTRYMMAVVIIVQLWVSLGTSFLTMRAGFSTVDRSIVEAGLVDGIKNRFQELWHITLPAMTPHLILSVILSITGAFGAEAVITAMTGFPSTGYATHTIMHHLRDYGFIRFQRGYACAIAVILFLLCIIVNRLAQILVKRIGK
ncbi:MAG: sugar ABC transporter permease [Clostridiales bacterium]|nr:sugar ABC transporter permease [Clostridiales bacterium]